MPLGTLLLFTLVVALLGGVAGSTLLGWFRTKRVQRRFSQGRKGEKRAREELLRLGFVIVEEQPRVEAVLVIDGEEHPYTVRGDFLVERGGERALVEVKTGSTATDPLYAPTRRQLREYDALFHVKTLYLLNGKTLTLQRITFPEHGNGRKGRLPTAVLWIAVLGLALGVVCWLYC